MTHITHSINSIINTEVYPKIFKISSITPIKKHQINQMNIDSYRPINNQAPLEKSVEQHIKTALISTLKCTGKLFQIT